MNITLSKNAASNEEARYTVLHGLIGFTVTVQATALLDQFRELTGEIVGIDTAIGDDEAMELRIHDGDDDYWIPLMNIKEVVYL